MSSVEHFRIGELGLTLSRDAAARFVPVSAAMQQFADSGEAPAGRGELQVHASIGPLPTLCETETSYDRGSFWRAYEGSGAYLFACTGTHPHAGVWRVIRGDAGATRWQVITDPEPPFVTKAGPLPDPFAFPAAELIVLSHLATRQAAIVHACGVDDRGAGYLFCGRSGAGKSTLAGFWSGSARVLNDDRVLLRREAPGRYRIHGTPWHGDHAHTHPGGAPLRAAFFLEHGADHRVGRLDAANARRRWLTTCWLPIWDRARGLPQTLALCGQLARELPAYRLVFRRDAGVCDAVRSALPEGPA